MRTYKKGMKKLGIDPDKPLENISDELLAEAQETWFPDSEKERLLNHSYENVPENELADLNGSSNGKMSWAKTVPEYIEGSNKIITGKSSIYYNNTLSFTPRQLFYTMGHELVHVSQIALLYDTGTQMLTNKILNYMEYGAHDYERYLGAKRNNYRYNFSSWDYDKYRDKTNPSNFPWTHNSRNNFKLF